MNNSMYTTIPPELECLPLMTPDEEMEHYLSVIEEPIDDLFNDEPMHSIRSFVAGVFCTQANIQVNDTKKNGKWGLDVPKTDTPFVCEILDFAGINYSVEDARYLDIRGRWTHKSFNIILISDDDFRVLAQKLRDEIVIIGDDSL